MIFIIFKPNLLRKVPTNYIILVIFTFTISYFVSAICSYSDPNAVFIAIGMTLAMTIGITIYCFYTKTDFTIKYGLLFSCSCILLVAILFSIFYSSRWSVIIIALIVDIIFAIYLIYDTQLIIGKFADRYDIDDYILAALNLYTDVISIFLMNLQLSSS